MDAFYASVEQHDRPELRGKPLLIGFPGPRSVVTTASYEARPYGCRSAMPMLRAMRLCPQAIVVEPRFRRYQEVSHTVMGVFATFSPKVEPLSLDEAFLDMTGAAGLFGPPEEMGRKVRAAVKDATGLTVSVGVAPSKYVAKVASDYRKPDGLTVVPPEDVLGFLHPQKVSRLWGVGPKAEERLARLGLRTIGDVYRADPARLARELGGLGVHVALLARGEDPREVEPDREQKSVGSEVTLAEDVVGADAIRPHLLHEADEVARRLRAGGHVARGVRVKLKTSRFQLHTRQTTLPRPTDSAPELLAAAVPLLAHFDLDEPIRLVGLAAFDLGGGGRPVQEDLFAGPVRQRQGRLDRTLDQVRARFGAGAVRRASELADDAPEDRSARREPRPGEDDEG
jgi:DNA polymerase-4